MITLNIHIPTSLSEMKALIKEKTDKRYKHNVTAKVARSSNKELTICSSPKHRLIVSFLKIKMIRYGK